MSPLFSTTWAACWTPATWREYLGNADASADLPVLRHATALGRPLGTPAFIDRLEQQTGLRLRSGNPGRPKKDREK